MFHLCCLTHIYNSCARSDIDILLDITHNAPMNDLARDPKQIGNLIRRARKKQALTQKALGDKAGLRQETISLIENGHPAQELKPFSPCSRCWIWNFRLPPVQSGGQGYANASKAPARPSGFF